MTAYFDAVDQKIRDLTTAHYWAPDPYRNIPIFFDGLRAIETSLVFDCTVAVMLPWWPHPDLREAVHRAVLAHGIESLPETATPADNGEMEVVQWASWRISRLNSDLHDIWHEVAHRGGTDNPRGGVLDLFGQGEMERERLAAEDPQNNERVVFVRQRAAETQAYLHRKEEEYDKVRQLPQVGPDFYWVIESDPEAGVEFAVLYYQGRPCQGGQAESHDLDKIHRIIKAHGAEPTPSADPLAIPFQVNLEKP